MGLLTLRDVCLEAGVLAVAVDERVLILLFDAAERDLELGGAAAGSTSSSDDSENEESSSDSASCVLLLFLVVFADVDFDCERLVGRPVGLGIWACGVEVAKKGHCFRAFSSRL